MINRKTGNLRGSSTRLSDFIKYLQEHQEVYGDTLVRFEIHGDAAEEVQFEHFKNVIAIDVREEVEE